MAVALAVGAMGCSGAEGNPATGDVGATSTTSAASSATITAATEPPAPATTESPTTAPPPSTEPAEPMHVLVFHKTAGFRHESIPAGIDAVERLGERQGFDTTVTDDASVFTPAGLESYAAVVFMSTTGDILDRRQQEAFEAFVRSGGGFIGVHAAADTEYDWEWYGGLVGAYFDRHPAPQEATVEIVAPDHPTMAGLPATVSRFDEWYDFRTLPGPDVTVLALLDEASYEDGGMGDPHPIMWAHEYDGGRSFYTGFGHTIESFSEPLVLDVLGRAIGWVTDSP